MRLLLALAALAPLHAQQFDVASIKVVPPSAPSAPIFFGPASGGPGTADPTHLTWKNLPLKSLVMTAYDVKAYQVDAPAWLESARFDIAVSIPDGATKAQVNVMWQRLLAERFGMTIHHESREFQADDLVVARGGHKLKETTQTGPAEVPPKFDGKGTLVGPGMITRMVPGPNGTVAEMMAVAQTLPNLANMLSSQLGHLVVDKTGLTGKYDFTIEHTPNMNPGTPLAVAAPSDAVPDLAAAVQQQLGLRLEKGKAMLDVIVVDKAEKVPTQN